MLKVPHTLAALVLLMLACFSGFSQVHHSVYYTKYPLEKNPLGKEYHGNATFYGKKSFGDLTASGERLRHHTAAHKTLPFGSMVEVTNLKNGKKTIVKVIDRGPFGPGRIIDLSYDAAKDLTMTKDGIASVRLRVIGLDGVVLLEADEELLDDRPDLIVRANK